uniref:NADH-ubiquinone oxidoreductase chain 4L n=1 Tax=Uroplatus fimbriatus TaxID=402375 RepID=A0A0A1H7D6_9SAUR|nr:NADH dehydrogenase subunit 4L [Uroplatus fimbriatus]BAP90251.1 NADH dehydrogenase subunit 4L [Uroplatus fimbriatus]
MALHHFTLMMMFILNMLGITFYRKHLVSALLCLESMFLTLFMALATTACQTTTTNSMLHPLVLLAIATCGAGVGLALLAASARTHATDHLKALSLLKC